MEGGHRNEQADGGGGAPAHLARPREARGDRRRNPGAARRGAPRPPRDGQYVEDIPTAVSAGLTTRLSRDSAGGTLPEVPSDGRVRDDRVGEQRYGRYSVVHRIQSERFTYPPWLNDIRDR